jgi:hypothetical protein
MQRGNTGFHGSPTSALAKARGDLQAISETKAAHSPYMLHFIAVRTTDAEDFNVTQQA